MEQLPHPTITAHCLVKNEENFIGYAINSVLPYVDKMIIFDTGSTDETVDIIRRLIETSGYKDKIHFELKGSVDVHSHTRLRNEMVTLTTTDWFMVLDGDEVWPDDQIDFLINKDLVAAEKLNRNCILVYYHLVAGDLEHYTESGHFYADWGLHGHFTFRCFRKVNDLYWNGQYNHDIPTYQDGTIVHTQENTFASTSFFWHLSKLPRSSKDVDVFLRKKKSKMALVPHRFRKLFYKRYHGDTPKVFYADK